MRAWILGALLVLAGCATTGEPAYCGTERARAYAHMRALPDWDVAWIGTALSQQGYEGNCPCPTSTDALGNRCGERSAYSRGARLACTPDDIPRGDLSHIRQIAARMAASPQCGGMGQATILSWPSTPRESLPRHWR